MNSSSSNAAPSEINATTSLSFSESLALGAIAVDFNATDTNSDANLSYRVQPKIDISSIPGISGWFDASDMDSLTTDLSGNNVLSWANQVQIPAVEIELRIVSPQVSVLISTVCMPCFLIVMKAMISKVGTIVLESVDFVMVQLPDVHRWSFFLLWFELMRSTELCLPNLGNLVGRYICLGRMVTFTGIFGEMRRLIE